MRDLTFGLAMVMAVLAAARSTYSPCGLSMLSTITRFGEKGRRHRHAMTASWFTFGSLAGGATLGVAAALGAAAVSAAGVASHPGLVSAIGASVALVAACVDAGVLGTVLPLIRRQVDDHWLSSYRPWVYGAGFGWQVGVGVATYVMTAGVFALVTLAILTASPGAALTVCATFGLARGLTVWLTATANGPTDLRALHARLDRAASAVRATMIAGLVVSGAVMVGHLSTVAGVAVGVSVAAATLTVPALRGRRGASAG